MCGLVLLAFDFLTIIDNLFRSADSQATCAPGLFCRIRSMPWMLYRRTLSVDASLPQLMLGRWTPKFANQKFQTFLFGPRTPGFDWFCIRAYHPRSQLSHKSTLHVTVQRARSCTCKCCLMLVDISQFGCAGAHVPLCHSGHSGRPGIDVASV